MRQWFGIFVALLMIGPASAQLAAGNDAAGDQEITYAPANGDASKQSIQNDMDWFPNFDITRAGIFDETENNIIFEILVSSKYPTGTEPDTIELVNYNLYFTYHDEPMRVTANWYHEWADQPFAYVERLEGTGEWQSVAYARAEDHPDGEGWTFTVHKWNLRDTQLIPAREGDIIGDMYATAGRSEYDYYAGPIPRPAGFGTIYYRVCPSTDDPTETGGSYDAKECGTRVSDDAGTAADPLTSYTLTQSPDGLGHVLLESPRPLRASNGLATTYVYQLRLFNLDPEPDTISLAASNIPSGWDVYLPPRVEMAGNEVKEIRMAVGVPFGHKHGESAYMDIRAKSGTDSDSISETSIYVYWPEIAQPSGHHPRVYMHADGYRTWMNTASVDTDEDGSGVAPPRWSSSCTGFCSNGVSQAGEPDYAFERGRYIWEFYLRPGLFSGLDFEVDKTITGSLDVATRNTLDADVTIDLVLYRMDSEPLVIATQDTTASFTGGEATAIPITMAINADADRIPYEDYSALYFIVEVTGEETEPNADANTPTDLFFGTGMQYSAEIYTEASFLDLPLLDFHDDVDPGLLDALTRLQLEAPEEVVRAVNPGRTAAYFFEIINKGDSSDKVEWSIEGINSEWATVVPQFSTVNAHQKSTVAIRVDVPTDALQDDVADLLLVGQSTQNVEAQVFGNFLAYVETNEDIPDEAERFAALQGTAEETEARGTPFPTAIALAAVAMAGLLRRKRE